MKKLFAIITALSVLTPVLVTPFIASALTCPGTGEEITAERPCKLPDSGVNAVGSFVETLETITGWMFTFLMLFSVVMFIYAAYLYMFSGGSEESTAKAKSYILYAIIGLAVAMLAKGVPYIVFQLL